MELPRIDVAPLLDDPRSSDADRVAAQLDKACRELGFFTIVEPELTGSLLPVLDREARRFFAEPDEVKADIAMARAGSAWRGWFPVDGELTSGRPDHKEGIYFGRNHTPDHPGVVAGTPLHGANLYPAKPPGLRAAVDAWMDRATEIGLAVMRGLARGLGLEADWFDRNLIDEPTVLFRIFHYPAGHGDGWGVGAHSDYGLLTLLAQDDCGGLQVREPNGDAWIDVPGDPSLIVCNLGDMLERLTEGRYRSTLHRVRNISGRSRLSFPLFLDPAWTATVPTVPLEGTPPAADVDRRWDGADVQTWEGVYGDYLTAKVSKVFPDLFAEVASGSGSEDVIETIS
ncbi:MAG: isopenicillin N synthase family oxygenase [Acidimicrobiia bacterium]|nr:isopenicillin N synthase family oxygenase [Acidimicrobiia bacterium]